MSRSIIQPEKIVTEISGVVTKGMDAFGMQAVIVQNEDPALTFRYFVRAGTEVEEVGKEEGRVSDGDAAPHRRASRSDREDVGGLPGARGVRFRGRERCDETGDQAGN